MVPYIGIGVVVALVVLVVIFLVLRYTKFGRSLYAVGGSEQSAAMMGLDVKKTKMKAYVLSSFLCSIGGICYCMNTMSASVSRPPAWRWTPSPPPSSAAPCSPAAWATSSAPSSACSSTAPSSTIVQTNGKLASSWPNILPPLCCASSSCFKASLPRSRKRTI